MQIRVAWGRSILESMKLFVAKLNRDAVESDLLEWFGAMGPVKSVKVVTDRDTGQSLSLIHI